MNGWPVPEATIWEGFCHEILLPLWLQGGGVSKVSLSNMVHTTVPCGQVICKT